MNEITGRLKREARTIGIMMQMYCTACHNSPKILCEQCRELYGYAMLRLAKCPFGYEKPICASCTIHCYATSRREQIRRVMRYSGPRLMKSHPRLALMHLVDKWRYSQKTAPRRHPSATRQ
ncbi:MAG: nitrous oxide-stimulated promoter family protein [Chitinivibrionales bacterium]|nr:nitrous oxide-stimulated promoter family protein [Chitinivibrionales bacterium]